MNNRENENLEFDNEEFDDVQNIEPDYSFLDEDNINNEASDNSDAYSTLENSNSYQNVSPETELNSINLKNNARFFRDQKPENQANQKNQNAISRLKNRKANTLGKKADTKDPINSSDSNNEDEQDNNENVNQRSNLSDKTKNLLDGGKEKLKQGTKDGVKKAGKATGEAVKKAGTAAAKGIFALATNPATAPFFWAGIIIFTIIIMVPVFIAIFNGGSDGDSSNGDVASNVNSIISLTHTNLSKEEFVAACDKMTVHKEFYSKCDIMYDMAIKSHFNPEMIVLRAYVEGYSPGASNNNYWGLGCYNGASAADCLHYSSFEDGVQAFIDNVSQYETLEQMLGKYAYIGDYWYNPGSSGSGGCYYYTSVKKYLSDSRAKKVEPHCAKGALCSGSSCLPTTDEDQLAYTRYQSESMVNAGNVVFGGVTSDVASSEVVDGSIPTSVDDLKNRYYFTFDMDSYFSGGDDLNFAQCVWYAKHRAMDIVNSSNLSDEVKKSKIDTLNGSLGDGGVVASNLGKKDGFTSTTNFNNIKAPAIISWSDGSYGHVGIIEQITTDSSGNKKYYITDAGRAVNKNTKKWYTVSKNNAWSVLLFPLGDSTSLTAYQAKNRDSKTFVAATSILE